jgi:hypothetical protein
VRDVKDSWKFMRQPEAISTTSCPKITPMSCYSLSTSKKARPTEYLSVKISIHRYNIPTSSSQDGKKGDLPANASPGKCQSRPGPNLLHGSLAWISLQRSSSSWSASFLSVVTCNEHKRPMGFSRRGSALSFVFRPWMLRILSGHS